MEELVPVAKFFTPGNNPQRSEEVYQWITRYVKAMLACEIDPARIYSVDYTYEGTKYTATVGQQEQRTGQLVIAIFKSDAYLICTPYYGVRMGEPLRVDFTDTIDVQYFEGIDHARDKLRTAVTTLDSAGGPLQPRLHSAATTLASVVIDDFPSDAVTDFLSVKHKLTWRGNPDDTIDRMSEAEAEDAAAAIRALYVDVLLNPTDPEPKK